MRATTHELVGVAGALAVARGLELGVLDTVAAGAGAVLGSRLPDADQLGARVHRRGRLARRSWLLAALGALLRLPLLAFALLARHRGATHSLAFCALLAALAVALAALAPASLAALAAGCALGYVAHVLADACTPTGVSLWWPLSPRRVWLLPGRLQIRTGSLREAIVALAAVMLALALLVA